VEEYKLEKPEIKVSKVGQQIEHFSSVIAKELTLTSHITKQYDNNTVLTILEIEGEESNLRDFKLKNYQRQGIEAISGDFDKEKLVYFVIIPIHEETLTFSYYNTQSSKIEIISSPIVHSEEIVSTQTDLNPHNSNVLLYKRVGVGILLFLCVMWLLFRRDKISLLVTVICGLYLIYIYLPNRNFLIKKDTNVFILPTKNSSVFFKTDSDVYVEVLDSQKGYIKVLLPDDKIGWVSEDDIGKN
ncbi:MAG: SH3 domain-containing protein, partial [Arcobacteraceae bacterium]